MLLYVSAKIYLTLKYYLIKGYHLFIFMCVLFSQGDCRSFRDSSKLNCAGKQKCNVVYTLSTLDECQRKLSTYLQVEYDCIPSTCV